MPIVDVPGFGKLDIKLEEGYEECYEAQLNYKEKVVEIDLNIEDELEDYSVLDATKLFVDNVGARDKQAREALKHDFRAGDDGSTAPYLEHHLQELGAEMLGFSSEDIQGLLSALHLERIGFYPEQPEMFAVFDYSLGESLTNYLLVVNFDAQGRVTEVVMES